MTVDESRHRAPPARASDAGFRAIPRVLVASAKVVVVFSLLALSFSTTYAASPGAFSDSDLLGILTLGGAVNGGALLVFGDHGALLSTNVAFADAPEFVVQDHFGALGGVYPPDACAEWFDEAQEKRGYLTLLDAVHTVIRCLSGGESALCAPPEDYYLGGWNGVVPDGHRRTYKEFLYE